MTGVKRCFGENIEIYREYHDREWGRPVLDERGLLEKLCLEGFQSGLSWLTILRKRDAFREAFANFDAEVVARFGPADVELLLADASIVRHRLKIEAAIANARATVALRETGRNLVDVVWAHRQPPMPLRACAWTPTGVAATGTSHASASSTASPKPSRSLGTTTALAALTHNGTRVGATPPRVSSSAPSASASSRARSWRFSGRAGSAGNSR